MLRQYFPLSWQYRWLVLEASSALFPTVIQALANSNSQDYSADLVPYEKQSARTDENVQFDISWHNKSGDSSEIYWSLGTSTSSMSKVCFIMSICNLFVHNVMVIANAPLRKVYGINLIITLHLMLILSVLNLSSCFVPSDTHICVAIGILTHYTVLCIPFGILVTSYEVWRTVYSAGERPRYSLSTYSQFLAAIFVGPVVLVAISMVIDFYFSYLEVGPGYGQRQCGIGCVEGYRHFLFIPILIIMLIQLPFVLSIIKMHHGNISERRNTASQPDTHARFMMTIKLTATNFIIWLVAYIANYTCLSVLWHLFTLFCALQSIFVLVNFTFSRHFFDVFFKRQEPKNRVVCSPSSLGGTPLLQNNDNSHTTTV